MVSGEGVPVDDYPALLFRPDDVYLCTALALWLELAEFPRRADDLRELGRRIASELVGFPQAFGLLDAGRVGRAAGVAAAFDSDLSLERCRRLTRALSRRAIGLDMDLVMIHFNGGSSPDVRAR